MKGFYPPLAKHRASPHNCYIESRARHSNFPFVVLIYWEVEKVTGSVDAPTVKVFCDFLTFSMFFSDCMSALKERNGGGDEGGGWGRQVARVLVWHSETLTGLKVCQRVHTWARTHTLMKKEKKEKKNASVQLGHGQRLLSAGVCMYVCEYGSRMGSEGRKGVREKRKVTFLSEISTSQGENITVKKLLVKAVVAAAVSLH